MVDILHRIAMKSSPREVYGALTTIEGLSSWWTRDTNGSTEVGDVIKFSFDAGFFDMLILELDPPTEVRWEVVDGPEEWIGTTVSWDLREDDEYTIILFKHEGWREPVEFMHHCSTHWAMFLQSLRSLVETGAGTPAPDDIKPDPRG